MELSQDKLNKDMDGEDLLHQAEDLAQDTREALMEWDVKVRSTVREHPFLTLAGALFGGYLVGRIVSRI